jgi:hypothetical protein
MLHALRIFRILTLLLAAILFIGGCNAVRHPKAKLVQSKPLQDQASAEQLYPHFATSKVSRPFGILRMMAGAGLAFYILRPITKQHALFSGRMR